MSKLPKIIAILGPTASGKTDVGIFLAKKFNGEVVSFDSRQIYKNMDIGTAKPPGSPGNGVYIVEGISHHLINTVDPDQDYSLADFKADAINAIDDILARGKLPILVGGTGLYFWAVIDNLDIPKVVPDKTLRKELEKLSLTEMVKMLRTKDPDSAEVIDLKNPRRVLRAVEVALAGESFVKQQKKGKQLYDCLQIGLNWPREELYERINARVDEQIKDGLVGETEGLVREILKHDSHAASHGVQDDSERLPRFARNDIWALPSMSGIGYRQMGYYLRGEMTLDEVIEILKRDTRRYAKRQLTWFKRDQRINWVERNDNRMAGDLVGVFLNY
ncbi:MAG: tRNA (adenosine(37)-N6)-dimethylallyltransferase MiaA [Candidatus Magasanikbacteria bacterium RIFOXYC2_FULL_42_28]|uniref:tRNA dimethylallyltransferase n=1 Tax=Candidatus Magasanikbacteria bacterium RIFOXYC2_FULL_42_28 TaxID=1798704 RepID=A0A1F6NWU3_9BACT|nr:MAG: tRNA (adenosine(37)-N6)-dimethylallyltransferase MiaA [Candidatus Magasanikbacteria bacterium RIFOXYC2_FULL_42_28]